MTFPFAITNTIILDQKEYGISSERYILNLIGEHMDEYGMTQQRPAENELFYIKMDPFNLHRKKDFIRNILIRVECYENNIKVTIKTETILLFFVALVAIIIPFTMPYYHIELQIMLAFMMILVPYSIKLVTLRSIKSEIKNVLNGLKK